ncbi:MAG: PAS domain S-box protein [Verrucomicrobia bacterium]|nr:PAS domain S-box protein [Verrucomicrobiota bacterium]
MIGVCVMAMVAMTTILYRHTLHQQGRLLQTTAQSQARLIEAVAQNQIEEERELIDENPDYDAFAATLGQVMDAHENYKGFGATGEFTLARRDGDSIVFVLRQRHGSVESPGIEAFDSEFAEPMRRALTGLSGIVKGLDYRGEMVLAAYEPVDVLNLGIVAKIDLAEIRAPFIRAWFFAAAIALIFILIGTVLFFWIGHPIIERLEAYSRNLEKEIKARRQSEEALVKSEENLSITMDSIGDGVIAADLEGRITRMNPVAVKLTGWPAAEAVGHSVDEVFHIVNVLSRAKVESPGQRALREGVVVGLANHTVLIRRDGTESHIADSASPIRNARGEMTGVVLVFRDVTELYGKEEAIRRSEKKYRTFFENSADAMLILENGEFVDCNDAAIAMLGYDLKEEIVHMHPSGLSPEVQPDGRLSAEKADELMRLAIARGGLRFEWDHMRKDGTIFPVAVSLTAIETDRGVVQLHTVWRDLTKRKAAEKEREQLMLAIEQMAEIVMITDAEANIQYVNAAFERVTGYCRAEALGQNPRILQSGQHPPEFYQEMWDILTAGKIWSGRLVNKKKDGHVYTEDAAISPVTGADGTITNYVAAKQDVTREMELEEQLRQAQKMEAVGQMAGGIAHDFNNLLQVIGGYAELSQMRLAPDSSIAPAIQEIEKAARRGKGLINQLLAFSRRQVIRPVDLNLNEMVNQLLNMIRGLLGEHIELDFIEGRGLGTVYADHGLMGQVLINLCVNARDAMPEGGKLTIETENVVIAGEYIQAHSWAKVGRYVLLSVTDTGCGMDPQTTSRIFEPFFTTKEVGKGTGLGLSMAFGIIKQHGGHIIVYSEVDKGTIFKIYLPTVERHATVVPNSIPGPVVGGTETILIAEDDEMVLKLAEQILSQAGYTVLTGRDGEEAVRLFEKRADTIDLVIMDVVMPRMGGKEAMDQILKLRPGMPHFFASGYSENAIHTNFIQERGMQLLSKPYQNESLLCKVREVIDSASE